MVGRHCTRNVNQLHEEPDPRDIKANELRQLVQQLQLHLEYVEAPRQNHNEPENEDSGNEEFNLIHVNRNLFFHSYVYKLATKVEKQFKEKENRKSATYGVSQGPRRGYATNQWNVSRQRIWKHFVLLSKPTGFYYGKGNLEDEYDIPPTFEEPQDEHEDTIDWDTCELLVIQRALHVESN
ncbi:hypothetical protein Tco_1275594 [Tanacetum coccineum]